MVRPAWRAVFAFALTLGCAALLAADPPRPLSPVPGPLLHDRIDSLVEAAAIGPLAPLCSDADFVRRVYLDLTGVIPTAEQARAFIADKSADKRERLIDELLASPAFCRHMTITLDVMLVERKPEKTIKQPEWEAYLYKSLADDKPLDQLFRELIAADVGPRHGRASLPVTSSPTPPAAKFLLDRDAEPNAVTRDIGRLVFGMDLQCCQCHDHPLIDDYYQDDYYGLFAFVHRTSLFTDAKTRQVSLTEKADGEASFKSVFTGASSDKAPPRLPKGAVLFVEPTFAKGDEYTVKPDKTVRGVPKFSRRAALAEMIPSSREFSRNLANRLWAHMFGRGIVHPVDFHYAGNPPFNPQLLTLLADELQSRDGYRREAVVESRFTRTSGFQLRPFLRELALTRTYQRSCDAPRPDTVNFADIAARMERLSRQKESESAKEGSLLPLKDALAAAKAEFKAARDQDAKIAAEVPKLEAALAAARKSLETASVQRRAAEEAAAKTREKTQSVAEAATKVTEAASQLPDNKTLADAAGKLAALTEELNAAIQVAQKTANERLAEHDSAAEQLAEAEAALATTTAARPSVDHLRELEQAQLAAEHRLSDANYAIAAIDAQVATCKSLLEYAALAKSDPIKAEAAWAAIVERWTIAGQLAPLKPLTPEQFAASAMQATGALAPQVAAATAKFPKSKLDTALILPFYTLRMGTADEKARSRSAAASIELELLNQLRGTVAEFVRQYGGLPGQEFQATVNQALFFGNGTVVDGWLKPAGENLVARLSKLDDGAAVADEIAWSVFSRPATDSERQAAVAYLKDRSDKPAALGEMVWALLSSTEFRFNH